MSITLKQLRIFLAVAHSQNLTTAARKLYLSKPAISMALKNLEDQLGHPLFDRLSGRLKINANGKQLQPLADELLSRSETLEQLFTGESLQGELKIGASRTIGSYLLPELLAGFRRQTGHHQQEVWINNSREICQQLQHYELDIGLIEAKIELTDLTQIPWGEDQMCVLAPLSHPLANCTKIAINSLKGSNWLLREPGSGSRQLFLQQLAPQLGEWHETLTFNDTEALINGCATGLGLTCVSELAAHWAVASGRVVRLNLPLTLKRPLFLVYPSHKYRSPLLQAFLDHCQAAHPNG